MKPRYEHDCAKCHFVGQHTDASGTAYDLYYHPGQGETLLARFSSEGPDYTSGSNFGRNAEREGNHDHPLYRALLAAREKGLIVPKTYYLATSTDYFAAHWDAFEKGAYYQGKPKLCDFVTPRMDDDAMDDGWKRHQEAVKAYNARWQQEHGELPETPPEGLTKLCKTSEEALRWAIPSKVCEIVADNDEHARELADQQEQQRLRWHRRARLSR